MSDDPRGPGWERGIFGPGFEGGGGQYGDEPWLPTMPGTLFQFGVSTPPPRRPCWRCRWHLRFPPWRKHWQCRPAPPLRYLGDR